MATEPHPPPPLQDGEGESRPGGWESDKFDAITLGAQVKNKYLAKVALYFSKSHKLCNLFAKLSLLKGFYWL